MKITLEELLAFTSVVDSCSITSAAEQLGQTTSGISRAFQKVCHHGVPCLMRSGGYAKLTL